MVGDIPAIGAIRMPPFSVCHQVSAIGALPFPIFSWYQYHASSFIGSPTDPSFRMLLRSLLSTYSSPKAMSERIAVGAVYKIFTLYFSTISQRRPASGKVWVTSNIDDTEPVGEGELTMDV